MYELVPPIGTGLDTGASKTWKSFKALYVATCIQLGLTCYGLPTKKGRACIVVAEGVFGYPKRMKALAKHLNVNIDELPAIIPAAPNLFKREQTDELIRQLKLYGPTYVVIDTKWRCSVGANEDSASDNAVVYGAMERIAQSVGCFVTAIAHVGNKEQTRARGSSSQFAAVDVEILHQREDDTTGTSTVSKLKDAPDGKVFTVKMLPIELGISKKTNEPFGSLVIEHVVDAPKRTPRAKQQPAGANQVAALQAIKSLPATGGKVNFYEAISAALKLRLVKTADMNRTKRQTMKDAFVILRDKKLIEIDAESNACWIAGPIAGSEQDAKEFDS